jgi:hypothetical protein
MIFTGVSIRLVDAPRRAHRPSIATPPLLEFWDIPLHPPHDSGGSQINLPLRHHVLDVAITQLVCDVPPDTESDDLRIKMTTFE